MDPDARLVGVISTALEEAVAALDAADWRQERVTGGVEVRSRPGRTGTKAWLCRQMIVFSVVPLQDYNKITKKKKVVERVTAFVVAYLY